MFFGQVCRGLGNYFGRREVPVFAAGCYSPYMKSNPTIFGSYANLMPGIDDFANIFVDLTHFYGWPRVSIVQVWITKRVMM